MLRRVEKKAMRILLSAVLLSVASLAGSTVLMGFAHAQEAATEDEPLDAFAGTIRSIIIEGNQRIETGTILSYLVIQPGSSFNPELFDLSLKALFATELFADVEIGRRGEDLVIRVVENPIINRVIFEGNGAIDDDQIRDEIQAEPRGVFTLARVQADVRRIVELYRQSGRFSAEVKPRYKLLDQSRVDLIFEITDGPTTGVRSINFIGNEEYSDARLRSEIVTRQSRLWRFFSSNDNYDPNRLEFDRELLRQFYQNKGYYDFRVTTADAAITPDQEDWYITFTIDEGRVYDFGEITVDTTLDKLNEDALVRSLAIREGELYEGDLIEEAIDRLTAIAGISGYAFVDVIPRITPNPDTGTVDITFALDEGPRVYIERINIIGNTRTLDPIIRRQLNVSEGDAFNRVSIDRSGNRVRSLGYFSNVDTAELPGSEPDRAVIDLSVEEQPTGELSLAAGFSSVDAFLIDISVSERNLRGRGQTAVARVSASQRTQLIDLRYSEPRFLGRNLAAGVSIFAQRRDFGDVGFFEQQSVGGQVNFGFPLTQRSTLSLRYRLSQDNLNINDQAIVIDANGNQATMQVLDADGMPVFTDPPDNTIPALTPILPTASLLPPGTSVVDICDDAFLDQPFFCDSQRSELTSSLGYTLQWSNLNNPVEPTRGYEFSISQDLAGVGGDVKFLRTTATAATHRGLFPGVRASLRFQAGNIFSFGNNETLRINNLFFRGGNSFRGFNVAGIGPRTADFEIDADGNETGRVFRGQALGGTVFYQGTLEVTLPQVIPEQYGIRAALFVEAGGLGVLEDEFIQEPITILGITNPAFNAGEPGELPTTNVIRRTEDGLGLRATAGLSVFWESPFGPIRFDFSQLITDEAIDRPRGFRFSTNTRF